MSSLGTFAYLCVPDGGVRAGALDHGWKGHAVTDRQLIHGLELERPAVVDTVGRIDALQVPTLRRKK